MRVSRQPWPCLGGAAPDVGVVAGCRPAPYVASGLASPRVAQQPLAWRFVFVITHLAGRGRGFVVSNGIMNIWNEYLIIRFVTKLCYMEWFSDGVAEAISKCRREQALFIVYIQGWRV